MLRVRVYHVIPLPTRSAPSAFFVDVLSSFLTSAKFIRYELSETVGPVCEAEMTAALHDPAMHALAFHNGLGNSIIATSGHHVSADDIKVFAQSVFAAGNVAVLGTGIDAGTLEKLLEQSLGKVASAGTPASKPSSYFGGETRIDAHHGPQTVFVGFGTAGAPAPELAVLASHLDPTPSVKWSQGTSPIAPSIPAGTSVRSVLLPYSDASLFGLLVQGQTTADVKSAAKAAVDALKTAGSLKGEELQKAVAKAKFAAASAYDVRDGLISTFGPKVSLPTIHDLPRRSWLTVRRSSPALPHPSPTPSPHWRRLTLPLTPRYVSVSAFFEATLLASV